MDKYLIFWFKMALAMKTTVRRLQAEMTPDEFNLWQAYYQVDPFGEERADHG